MSPRRLSLAILAVIGAALSGVAEEFYVTAQGSDANSGTRKQPFATLTRARDAVRQLKQAGPLSRPVTIHVGPGLYPLTQTLKLDAQDSGTAAAPVVYRGDQAHKPILTGGVAITNFTVYRGAILKADVGRQGFTNVYFRQLIFDGHRQPLARYPNFDPQNPYGGGWAYADGKPVPMYTDVPGENRRTFQLKPEDARHWANPAEGEVFVFARYNWWNDIVRIATVDEAARQITLAGDASYQIRPGDRYYVRNLFEELDAPGEWYLDRATWTLYFWPPTPLAGKLVTAPTTRTILELDHASHIIFRGFVFEGCEGTAVTFRETTNCLLAASVVRNVGDYHGSGVSLSGGQHNGVTGCDIFEIGSHGISLIGGDQKTLSPAGNFAENNYIHHTGVFYKQGVGVSLGGVGNRVANNLIHDCPRMGILFSGNNHVIELNHIRHVNLETEDTGAIYTGGRDWLGSRGCVIRYNYFHDILGYGKDASGQWRSPHFAWGVYLDDNTGGVDVIGNIVVRAHRAGIHLHNGRDNLAVNNLFIDSAQQQMECNGWLNTQGSWNTHLPTMIKGYESVMNEPAWRAMRNMQTHPTNAVLADGKIMTGNVFLRNIVAWAEAKANYTSFRNFPFDHNVCDSNLVWHAGQPILIGEPKLNSKEGGAADQWLAWQALGMDRHSLVADPLFVNPAKGDYRLRRGSPAFKLGFQKIPVEKIGPHADPLRASWPIVEAEGVRERPLVTSH